MIAFWHWENDEHDSDELIEPCCHKFIAGDRVFTIKDEDAHFTDQFGEERPHDLYDQMQDVIDRIAFDKANEP